MNLWPVDWFAVYTKSEEKVFNTGQSYICTKTSYKIHTLMDPNYKSLIHHHQTQALQIHIFYVGPKQFEIDRCMYAVKTFDLTLSSNSSSTNFWGAQIFLVPKNMHLKARTFLQPHYDYGVFGNDYLSARQLRGKYCWHCRNGSCRCIQARPHCNICIFVTSAWKTV